MHYNERVACDIRTQVHWAVRKGHPGVLRQLISRGWYVDESGRYGDTPLCIASEDASIGSVLCIGLLCTAGVRTEYAFFKLCHSPVTFCF